MSIHKKASMKDGRKSSTSSTSNMVLDQAEIMRAMLEARNSKPREESGSEDQSDEESEEIEREAEGSDENGKSSASTQRKFKRRRSLSLDISEEEEIEPAKKSQLPNSSTAGMSRMILTSRTQQQPREKPNIFESASKPSTDTSFEGLGLSRPLITALASINIRKPTEIQSACIKPILEGRDCIGGAKTGSGKTMAFALPIVERISRDPFGVWAVVLTPTRELAYQLSEQFLVIGKPLGLTTCTIVGGMDMMKQAQEFDSQPHIVVATPGRLCDLVRSGGVGPGKLSRVRTLVLDEADRMLTPTFAPDLTFLFSQIPSQRQTCLFTATINEAIMDLAKKEPSPGKERPFVYRVESDTLTVANLKQKYLFIPSQIRDPYLLYILQNPLEDIDIALRADTKKATAQKNESATSSRKSRRKPTKELEESSPNIPSTIIFTQRCATAHLLQLLLNQLDIPSVPLHSHLTQPQRLLSLARFRAREVPVLVTTDVSSRGLDIPEVAMVINWDCPRRSDDYVHRVGRTARAGRGGVAVTIVTERDTELIKMIEDEVNVRLEELKMDEDQVLEGMNKVSIARRMAAMEMHDSAFGERQATNKAKAIKRAKRDAAVVGS
nr:ATP-dependent RNA helicase DBP8 [Cryptococcus depauperatus CBS 7841]